ncbi:MAG: uracil-DNA glycosylase [Candidatus Hadarchaeum sp.]|jgi:DNA polymerase|nr:uracil-DNA glycosylase [Candidatus Hadarchaeum sp.]
MKSEAEKTLLSLKSEAEKCKRCGLYKTRTNVVFGIGPATAKVMLVGEAAGFFEDKQGVPFVGAAGKNLNALLREAGLKREDVYIGNVLKCRPPGNRPPLPDEIEACRPFLEGQISAVEPELVITLGRTAARALLGKNVVMGREHGTLLDCTYAGVKFKLFLTYHPAAALYGAEAKQKLQTDFKKLGQLISKMT